MSSSSSIRRPNGWVLLNASVVVGAGGGSDVVAVEVLGLAPAAADVPGRLLPAEPGVHLPAEGLLDQAVGGGGVVAVVGGHGRGRVAQGGAEAGRAGAEGHAAAAVAALGEGAPADGLAGGSVLVVQAGVPAEVVHALKHGLLVGVQDAKKQAQKRINQIWEGQCTADFEMQASKGAKGERLDKKRPSLWASEVHQLLVHQSKINE